MKKINRTIILIAAMLYGAAYAENRDPFMPYTSPSAMKVNPGAATVVAKDASNPLTDKPVSSYNVIGVAISPTNALAVIKSRDKQGYFAYVGDDIGSEGGKIEAINSEGVTINIRGKIVNLKVSNRFEMQDEKQTDESK
jgi:Tfp pilus assembly protein PilP